MNGLAIAIQVASVAMLLAPAALLGWFGRRRLKSRAGTVLGAALGLGLGWMAVQATFHDNSQLRTPSLTLQVPPGFAHEWIVLIADAKATNEVIWNDTDGSLSSKHGHVVVPKSGVVRVRTLGVLCCGEVNATLPDGKYAVGLLSTSLGDSPLVGLDFEQGQGKEPDIGLLGPEALAAFIRTRESE